MSTNQPPPNVDLHADQSGRINGTCAAMIALSAIFVFLRLLSRKLSGAGYWWDDCLTVLSLLFSNACCIILLIATRNGFARHVYIYGIHQVEKETYWEKCLFVFEIFFNVAADFSKFAVLAFYYRIFPVLRFRRICIWFGVVILVYLFAVPIALVFQCNPIHHAWTFPDSNSHGQCLNVAGLLVSTGSINLVMNFLIWALPLPLLWRLGTTPRQQCILVALFTLAGFVVIVSIVWVVSLSKVDGIHDTTWTYIDAAIWSAVEPNMAVICGCIPSLRPLASIASRRFAPPLVTNRLNNPVLRFTTTRSTDNNNHSSSRRIWERKNGNNGKLSDGGAFSQLHEPEPDDLRPLGHDTEIRGGGVVECVGEDREEGGERGAGGLEMTGVLRPEEGGIRVRTEVVLTRSERVWYDERLF